MVLHHVVAYGPPFVEYPDRFSQYFGCFSGGEAFLLPLSPSWDSAGGSNN
jgi:hypothetical protein